MRFNLEETIRMRSSPETENESIGKLNQSPELSINTDDEDGEDDEEEEEEEEAGGRRGGQR